MKKAIRMIISILILIACMSISNASNFRIISVSPTTVYPCEITYLKITIENVGTNTTYYVTATLSARQPIGIIGSTTIQVPEPFGMVTPNGKFDLLYKIYINQSAKPGIYPLTLYLTWKDAIYGGKDHQEVFTIGMNVRNPPKNAKLEIVNVKTEPKVFNSGEKGRIMLEIKNIGYTAAKSVDVYLVGKYPFVVLNSTAKKHIDYINPNETVNLTFNVGINSNITKRYYNIPIVIRYSDEFGSYTTNTSVGVEVMGKPDVQIQDITLEPTVLTPNTQGTLLITVVNAGTAPARNVRISIHGAANLLSENYKYLGTLLPGQTQTAMFGIYVPKDIEFGDYGLTININYETDNGSELALKYIYTITVYPPTPFIPVQYVIAAMVVVGLIVLLYIAVKREIKRRGQA